MFISRKKVPDGGGAVVKVGRQSPADTNRANDLPRISVVRSAGRRRVRGSVRNHSDIPQFGLNVYAHAVGGGRDIAAGRARIAELGPHETAGFELRLIGAAGRGRLLLEAPATVLK